MVVAGQSSVAVLFDLLRTHPQTTRTALVQESGLSKATVSEAIAELLAHGFIAEVGKHQPGRGRSQVVLEFNPSTCLVIGVQFTETGCHAVLADLRAGAVAVTERPLTGTRPDDFIEALCHCVEELSGVARTPILGVGVGVPGLVDPAGRVVVASVPYGWDQVPIADMLEPRLNLPVVVANRAKAAALGEYWQGNHVPTHTRNHLAYVHVGSGIVTGFVIEGELFFGSGGAAGEIGHMTIVPDGPLCGCGNRGCLHMLASESAIVRSVRAKSRHTPEPDNGNVLPSLATITIPSLIAAAGEGNELVLDAIAEAGAYLGIAIANVVNLMNPSLIVIGGSVAAFGEPLFAAIRAEVRQRALWDALNGVPIVPSALGDDAGTVGAAALFLDQVNVGALLASRS
ncbi:MAG: ROK family transcriptional regulator [Chloroflexota bacterium]|nr:ROK family transcriptional regulator [Chloroflexota bacterium]